MIRSRILAWLMAAVCCCCLCLWVSAAEVDCDDTYCFSAEEFGENLAGICITDVPAEAPLALGERSLRPGDILTAQQVAQMTLTPERREETVAASISYLPIYEDRVAEQAVMTISIRGKADNAPVAEDSAGETYKNLPLEGKLKVKEPENQTMTFAITRQPKRGTVEIHEDGSFTYTPKKNKVGVDSFIYTATDETGHVSREAKVTVTILKPTDSTLYTDTIGKTCRFAAEWMKNTGIFSGETLGGSACFQPEEMVTRGEFVAMLVKSLDMEVDAELTSTHYTDDMPAWLRPYLAAAVRAGLTAGLPNSEIFGAEEIVTGAEAAVMIQNALDITADEVAAMAVDGYPEWAKAALNALNGKGFALDGEAYLTRADVAEALYTASLLMEEAPGMKVLRMQ